MSQSTDRGGMDGLRSVNPSPASLCECGCGSIVTPGRRLIRGHWARIKSRTIDHSQKWDIDASGCWNYNRHIEKNGYGKIRNVWAHRFVYQLYKGPIPPGLDLDHLCRNRRCVNPDHLQPVTRAENSRRGLRTKLSLETVRAIKLGLSQGAPAYLMARRYDISYETVAGIKHGRRWKDV